ncbi:MAG TPA: hypothetical protein VKU19_39190 [Bryobacteraceae bacterium]|nr:hypothetical protein [Bryobacteraceae bacterium]
MAGGAAAAAAAIANAIKASGVLIKVEPEEFSKVMRRVENPLIVITEGGIFSRNYQYLMSYKGLTFFTKSGIPLALPANVELVTAGRIWIPG